MTFITNMWFIFITNVFKISIMTNDLSDLFRSIPSEISILSYCNVFISYTSIHLKKSVDNIYHFLQKHLMIVILRKFNCSFKGNL